MKLLCMYIHRYSLRPSVPSCTSAKLIIFHGVSLLSDQYIQSSSKDEVFRTYLRFAFDVKGVLDVSVQPGVLELLCSDSRDSCCVGWRVRGVEVQT